MHGFLTIYEFDRAGRSRLWLRQKNIITTAGLAYYAARMGGGTPANFVDGSGDFDGVLVLGSAFTIPAPGVPSLTSTYAQITSPIAASIGAPDSGYPKTADDGTNPESATGLAPLTASSPKLAQCVTYAKTYAVGALGAVQVRGAVITNPSPGASEPLLAFTLISPAQVTSASNGYRLVWNHFFQGS